MSHATNLLNTSLGQYELRALLNEGSLVTSYRAYQPSLNRDVLVQMLPTDLRKDSAYRQALARGAEIIAAFEHPNIVPILDYGTHEDMDYIVMRLMQGGSLHARLKNGVFALQEAATVVRQLAGALDYVHSVGRLHGDPATINIIFDSWGSAYFTDFLLSGFREQFLEGVLGVPLYMAPERCRMEPPSPSTDQYALAAIGYEMLTGQPAFSAEEIMGVFYKHLNEIPQPVHELRPDAPPAVNAVLLRALAKEPEDRYATVMDFAREFEKALNTLPGHLFISYSRRDKDYAQQLKQHFLSNDLPLWIDEQIEHGEQWFNQIHEAIKNCAAFVVIMSPESEQSEWVQKEVLLAKRYQKPIFPLLLKGQEFALLIDIQYADVRRYDMPGTDFHRRISRAIYGAV